MEQPVLRIVFQPQRVRLTAVPARIPAITHLPMRAEPRVPAVFAALPVNRGLRIATARLRTVAKHRLLKMRTTVVVAALNAVILCLPMQNLINVMKMVHVCINASRVMKTVVLTILHRRFIALISMWTVPAVAVLIRIASQRLVTRAFVTVVSASSPLVPVNSVSLLASA